MLSTNNWRVINATKMLEILEPYLCQLPILSANDITFSESIKCFTYEIRKEYSVSGYPNLGKGFSSEEAKLSGLMESLEMCCIEALMPLEWYSTSLQQLIEMPDDYEYSSNIELSAFIGDKKLINPRELIVREQLNSTIKSKSLTNGLASGQLFDDSVVHSVYEIIERHIIGSSVRSKILPIYLNKKFQSFLDNIEKFGLSCFLYLRGSYANTVTIECHIIDNSMSTIPQPYGGVGFGCSGNSDIAIARAIAEAFQCLSVSKSIYLQSYGIGTYLTGPMNGYEKDFNNFYSASIALVPYILDCHESSIINANSSLSEYNHVHTYPELIQDLKNQGIIQLNYIVLTSSKLPFTVVRCFADQLSNSYRI